MNCNGSQVKNMDNRVSVEGYGPMSSLSLASRSLRVIALAAALALTACGGGGGGGDDGGNPPPPDTGEIAATVVDQFDAPINGVTITAGSRTATTGSAGTATVTQVPVGSVSVTASAAGLVAPPAKTVTVTADTPATVDFIMERVTQAAGGVTVAIAQEPTDGSSFTFRMRVFVINEDGVPVENLTAEDFTLADCQNVDGQPNCVRGNTAAFDVEYTVDTVESAPTDFRFIDPDPDGPVPYAAAVLLDSSESIAETDPTDARIFANRVFLDDIGSGNFVMLSAFADAATSLLPEDLTIYPCSAAPCPAPEFTDNGDSLFPSLDSLATSEGGGTPLYASLTDMLGIVDATANQLPSPPANLRRAVVLFSDGKDIYCDDVLPNPFLNCLQTREQVVSDSVSLNVDILTIGLGANVDSLSMAELALRGRGSYLFADAGPQLIPIYGVLGRLLSKSMPTYEMVWKVNAAVPGAFNADHAVIGRLTINTVPAFTLPFVVQID
jgi:Carboxypeptidase regulatory-like domain